MRDDARLPRRVIPHLTSAPGHRHDHAQANCFAECLFHRETRGQKTYPARRPAHAASLPCKQLLLAKDALGKTLPMPLQRSGNPADVTNICSDAVNHTNRTVPHSASSKTCLHVNDRCAHRHTGPVIFTLKVPSGCASGAAFAARRPGNGQTQRGVVASGLPHCR